MGGENEVGTNKNCPTHQPPPHNNNKKERIPIAHTWPGASSEVDDSVNVRHVAGISLHVSGLRGEDDTSVGGDGNARHLRDEAEIASCDDTNLFAALHHHFDGLRGAAADGHVE